ncbi:GNAT family N-acetyltransferase [Myxococcota bacterium]|nr:GNAT family N-acetyltransferase [Myxococcota bacterium]
MSIRPARLEDLDVLVRGNLAMALETEELTLDEPTLRAGVRAVLNGETSASYRVLEHDGRVVAQLMITHEWSDWRNRDVWWIQSVYVAPEDRGHGWFRRLYEGVVDEARRAGAGGVRLYVDTRNTRAQAVYQALGMSVGHYAVCEAMF